jgi:eukaryotic-like serine/threonine-protein kinase
VTGPSVTLAAGLRIGSYEVIAPLGAGGMGEVYRARDVRLDRDVALKVLPTALALDAGRRARFDREARVLAALNHPNIATLYGIEQSAAGLVLVMELVEGDTLADWLKFRGRAAAGLPVGQALAIAEQVASALDAAHQHGIIHRDLKPANILVRSDGTVKVLDFGLAKVVDAGSTDDQAPGIAATATDIHGPGAGPGTPAYMSPEQARGEHTDKRTDIWAFGCTLYELLAGRRPFPGERGSDVMAKVLERDPDFAVLPSDIPAAIRRLLRRCLEKDPRDRLRDIGDARLEIRDAHAPDSTHVVSSRQTHWRWALAGAVVAVLAAAAVSLIDRPAAGPSTRVTRFSLPVQTRPSNGGRSLVISPDGSRLAYASERGITIRSRDQLDREEPISTPVAFPSAPFFSPDGEWIGYTDGQALFRMPATGGAPTFIATVRQAALASWSTDGIVFADVRGLFRVSAAGGTPESLRMPPLGATEQAAYPELLAGGRAVLFTVLPTRTTIVGLSDVLPGTRLEVLNLDTGISKTLVHGGSRGHYLPSGRLLYAAGGSLYGVPFDLKRLEIRGDPVQVISDLSYGEFAVADDGTLAYLSGGGQSLSTLTWVDRRGHEEALDAPPRPYRYPRLSPDGMRVALDIAGPPDRDIWIWDLQRRAFERFTFDAADNPIPAWSPDGTRIAFGSDRFGPTQLFLQRADRSDDPQRVLQGDRLQMPIWFAPDGRLLFSEDVPERGRDIRALSLDGSLRVESLVDSPGNDASAEVSPDGRWLAYDSDESGQFEVYVRPYPDAHRARWQVSLGGGRQPVWSRDGRELFYRDFSGAVLSVRVVLRPTFAAGPALKILDGSGYVGGGRFMSAQTYDVSLDGRRFLMLKRVPSAPPSIVIVLNWMEELKRRVRTQ